MNTGYIPFVVMGILLMTVIILSLVFWLPEYTTSKEMIKVAPTVTGNSNSYDLFRSLFEKQKKNPAS